MIRSEQGFVKDVVDFPSVRNIQAVGRGANFLGDSEGPIASFVKRLRGPKGLKVGAFKPNLVALYVLACVLPMLVISSLHLILASFQHCLYFFVDLLQLFRIQSGGWYCVLSTRVQTAVWMAALGGEEGGLTMR